MSNLFNSADREGASGWGEGRVGGRGGGGGGVDS